MFFRYDPAPRSIIPISSETRALREGATTENEYGDVRHSRQVMLRYTALVALVSLMRFSLSSLFCRRCMDTVATRHAAMARRSSFATQRSAQDILQRAMLLAAPTSRR